jgi:hypothetical protein
VLREVATSAKADTIEAKPGYLHATLASSKQQLAR